MTLDQAQVASLRSSYMGVSISNSGYRYFQQIFEFNLKIDSKKENYELVKESVEERDIVINNVPYANRYIALCVPTRNIVLATYYYVHSRCNFIDRPMDVP